MDQMALQKDESAVAGRTAGLEVRELVRRYSEEVVVGPISFSVEEGEFFSLLGPSGCGKSTTLRAIAGFESVDAGSIHLRGRRVDSVAPHKRDVGLVFQSHALFPHLTVGNNIAFGLELRKVEESEIRTRVAAALEMVDLSGYESRMPSQISGGQQQRVALARSLVLEPSVLLLDEPLSSLDLKLRIQMREELRRLQRRLRKTSIFVTHDQTEALALSDRIAVLSEGRIEQIGTPGEIYNAPASRFVADFIGNSNLLSARVVDEHPGEIVLLTDRGMRLTARAESSPTAREVTALIRPERISIVTESDRDAVDSNCFRASITDVMFLGEDTQIRIAGENIDSLLIILKSDGRFVAPVPTSGQIYVCIDPGNVSILER
jgi:spermidine/putrescine transport system ATP-binding protein